MRRRLPFGENEQTNAALTAGIGGSSSFVSLPSIAILHHDAVEFVKYLAEARYLPAGFQQADVYQSLVSLGNGARHSRSGERSTTHNAGWPILFEPIAMRVPSGETAGWRSRTWPCVNSSSRPAVSPPSRAI